jgi:putative ABC transport system permease protein
MHLRTWLDDAARDVRFALRLLRRSPAFAIAAGLTLTLAIAVNTAVFTVVDGVLLKPLPYPEPSKLALVTTTRRAAGMVETDHGQTGTTWLAIRDHATTIDTAAYSTWPAGVNMTASGRASYVQQQQVGAGFFRVLGVPPLVGREFTEDEDRPGGPAAVILSHELWAALFNEDPTVIGRSLMLRGEAATIVGVMPSGFRSGAEADLWTPIRPSTTGAGEGENYLVLARLRPGIEWAQAEAEIEQIGAEVARARPLPAGASMSFWLDPLQRAMAADLRSPILLLWAAVGMGLLIACVNLAGLQLARTAARSREIATRMALGSGRLAMIQQLVIESVVLAALGWVGGIALGGAALQGLKSLAADALDIWQPVTLDGRAAAAAGILAFIASLLFGVVPAIHATRLNVQATLVDAGSRAIASGGKSWLRRLLIVAQVALGVMLLVGAGLLLRTFVHLRQLNPGFEPSGLVTASVSLQDARYRTGERVIRLVDETLARVTHAPGISGAAVSLGLPYERLLNLGFRHLDGPEAAAPRGRMTSTTYVAGDFFGTLRIPLRAGRVFDEHDHKETAAVAIVNETFARQYLGDRAHAVGRRIALAGAEREIVGIVGDVQVRPGWGDNGPLASMPLVYIPLGQANDAFLRLVHGWFSAAFIVRAQNAADGVGTLRRAIDATDPLLPFARVRNMAQVQEASLARQRFLMVLVGSLALAAVLLAAVGLHGLIATTVIERSREMGIRVALGATMPQAMRSLALPGILLAAGGTVVGIPASFAFVRLLKHYLWGVSSSDPVTFVCVAALLLVVAVVASVIPALRILRLEPAAVLR